MTYKIIRKFYNDDQEDEPVAKGLTLKEAQLHCWDRETSSTTCTSEKGMARTFAKGPWFDAYQEE
jgi:hypothetical protein